MGSLMPGSAEIHITAASTTTPPAPSSVLELGSPLRPAATKPPRKLVFMTFSGEEEGLIGSDYYVKHPVFPLKKTIAMINLDMVGPPQETTSSPSTASAPPRTGKSS